MSVWRTLRWIISGKGPQPEVDVREIERDRQIHIDHERERAEAREEREWQALREASIREIERTCRRDGIWLPPSQRR